jgi:hypothetical protein
MKVVRVEASRFSIEIAERYFFRPVIRMGGVILVNNNCTLVSYQNSDTALGTFRLGDPIWCEI